MNDEVTQEIIQSLNDLELAILVCLISNEHCIIRAEEALLDDVRKELEIVCARTFGLSSTSIVCDEHTTLESFADAAVNSDSEDQRDANGVAAGVTFKATNRSDPRRDPDSRKVFNILIAKGLPSAARRVQIQALELMRTRRIYTRTAIHATPKRFLFVSLIPLNLPGPPYHNPHLNDRFFISHIHNERDDFATPPDSPSSANTSLASQSSIILTRREKSSQSFPVPAVPEEMIVNLQKVTEVVCVTAEIRRYTHNVTTFLRLHRAVAGGVSAVAARQLSILTYVLAPMHGLSYVTPSLVSLAARKVFTHRIQIATRENERSMQWGSEKEAVIAYLEDMTPEIVIEDILEQVEVPL